MMTNPSNYTAQPSLPRANVLSLVFFMLGAPHLYAFLKRSESSGRGSHGMSQYALMALMAGAIASLVELSIF